ncbi:MAG TPA: dephospho-CoA kinase [Thermoanaerobaculia bacterium]
MLRVGLTGGLASGKSTVAGFLAGLGCKVVDADRVVEELYEPGEPGYRAIVAEYGPSILQKDGSIDRVRVAAIAFATPEATRRLNELIHPLVLAREARMMADEAERASGVPAIFVVEATLLLESGGRERYDRIVVVDVPPEVQIERAVRRGMDRHDARRRIERQMARAKRLAAADYVIDNADDEAALERKTREVYESLLADARAKGV